MTETFGFWKCHHIRELWCGAKCLWTRGHTVAKHEKKPLPPRRLFPPLLRALLPSLLRNLCQITSTSSAPTTTVNGQQSIRCLQGDGLRYPFETLDFFSYLVVSRSWLFLHTPYYYRSVPCARLPPFSGEAGSRICFSFVFTLRLLEAILFTSRIKRCALL